MNRIEREKITVGQMIGLYCRGVHHSDGLCDDCRELLVYAHRRLERCPKGEGKGTCRRCEIHCYRPDMRRCVAEVMRYSGPRMILYHPLAALRHLFG